MVGRKRSKLNRIGVAVALSALAGYAFFARPWRLAAGHVVLTGVAVPNALVSGGSPSGNWVWAISDVDIQGTTRPILIPRPKKASLDYDHPVELGRIIGPLSEELRTALGRRYQLVGLDGKDLSLKCSANSPGIPANGYRVRIDENGFTVDARDALGLDFAIQRIASIAFARNGHLWLPAGTIEDWPSSPWRGVHLFVGPEALPFQSRLWDRVLIPLGFNKVVLQCERTAWDSTPGIEGRATMSRRDLARLFAMYRSRDVDPIPLIESFGHMGWLFNNGKNLDLALDTKAKWAIDPRKPGARALINNLWQEAIDLLHPKTIHFGMDEVSLRGAPGDSPLLTKLWTEQLTLLAEIAKRNHLRPMLWGDQALGPGEAVDYALASSGPEAKARRKAIPKGAMIADWHYAARSHPTAFGTSLDLWRREGFEPIAATWHNPSNITAFDIAATKRGMGTLQTTWAGYESSEANVAGANLRQFTAMVLAGEYSWSGRTDPPERLGYDPAEIFREMFFGSPHVVKAEPGILFGSGTEFRIGDVRFRRLEGLGAAAGNSLDLEFRGSGKELFVAVQSTERGKYGDPACEIEIHLDRVTTRVGLKYGVDVRSMDDPDICPGAQRSNGISNFRIDLGAEKASIRGITVSATTPGLRILGITLA